MLKPNLEAELTKAFKGYNKKTDLVFIFSSTEAIVQVWYKKVDSFWLAQMTGNTEWIGVPTLTIQQCIIKLGANLPMYEVTK